MTSTQPPQTPTRRRLPFSPAFSSPSRRSYGTPRRHKTPKSTRLQGVNAPQRTISQLAEEILAKLQLTFTPDLWQTHLVSRIQQGYDCIFVAGTGYGKSLIFEGLAATGGPGKALVIVSPLKALERDQVEQATQKGLKAIHINEDNTKTAGLWKEARTLAQMIYISPEMALSPSFIKLWKDAKFRKRVQAIIVDEAHCIDEWGEEFRPKYRELEMLRSFTGQEIPFVACTATCTTHTFDVIWKSLGYGNRPFWGLDAGCSRPNLFLECRVLQNTKNPILDVLNLLPHTLNETTQRNKIDKGLCYFDSEFACAQAVHTLRQALPAHLRDCVYAFSSSLSEEAKQRCWEGLTSGRYRIICCTDAAGMGCNVPDIQFTVIFGCPRSLSIVTQRWGRAGRDRTTLGTCLLLVPKWAFRPTPPIVGVAVRQLQGKKKEQLEPKTHTEQRLRLENNLESFVNLQQYSEPELRCSHKFIASTFRPYTGISTFTSLNATTPKTIGKRSQQSEFDLSWTILELDRKPPPNRCCGHCNSNILRHLMPSNQSDPRLLQFSSEFIRPLAMQPPSRPPSQTSVVSDISQTTTGGNFTKAKRSISNAEKAHLTELLKDWQQKRHKNHGGSPFLSPLIILPPKLLKKLVDRSGGFFSMDNVGRREILKVITWDFATDDDFRDVGAIIDSWRREISVSQTPGSQRRISKRSRQNESRSTIPPPIFTPLVSQPPVSRPPFQMVATPQQQHLVNDDVFQTPHPTTSYIQTSPPSSLIYQTPLHPSTPVGQYQSSYGVQHPYYTSYSNSQAYYMTPYYYHYYPPPPT